MESFPGPWGHRHFLPWWPGKELLTMGSVLGNVWTANFPVLPPIQPANLQNPALGQLLYHPQLLEATQYSACAGCSIFTELNAKLIFFSLIKAHSYAYWTAWKMIYSTLGHLAFDLSSLSSHVQTWSPQLLTATRCLYLSLNFSSVEYR